ncbi:MAG: hypothetical protein V7644_2609 [Actinomycetota bacterium]
MIWVTWRQQRLETLAVAGLVAAVTALLVLTGLHMGDVYAKLGVGGCLAQGAGGSAGCQAAVTDFAKRFSGLKSLVGWFNLLPVLVGILFAAPLVHELEHGTYRLAWTQSITRRRWLATKVTGAVAGTLLATLVLTLAITWWRGPFDRIDGRLDPNNAFNFEGVVPYAYALFALALVLAIGTIGRRLILAVAGGFAGFLALRLPLQFWARASYVAPAHFLGSVRAPSSPSLAHAWVLQKNFVNHAAPRAKGAEVACFAHRSETVVAHCMAGFGYLNEVTYQPASRFWELQGVEAAIFLAVALALLGLTSWWIRRRVT